MQFKSFMEALKGNQHKLDKNKNGKLDAHDFKLLQKEEDDIEEGVDRITRADYKEAPSGRKSHKEITFKNGEPETDEDKAKSQREEVEMEEAHQVVAKTKEGETFKSAVYPTKKQAMDMHYKMSKGNKYAKVDTVKVQEETELDERSMTDAEMKKREEYVKGMKKNVAGFKAKYGERAKDVMYATATKMAMKEELDEAAAGHTIEAHGVKGMKSTPWRKTFKHADHLNDWAEKNDAEVHGTRDLEGVKEEVSIDEAFINGREYASHGLMHPDHAKMGIHQKTGNTIDFYHSKTGDKIPGKVTKNDGKEVHIRATNGDVHKFKVTPHLPKQNNEELEMQEQAPVAPALVKHRIGVTVSEPDHPMVSKRKEKVQKFVNVTHSDNKEGAQKVGEKFYKKKGFIVHDSHHAGMVNEEVEQIDELSVNKMLTYRSKATEKLGSGTAAQDDKRKEGIRVSGLKVKDKNSMKKEEKQPPFDGPYKKAEAPKTDKSGAVHSPMSRARHLAQQAMKKQVKEDVYLEDLSLDDLLDFIVSEDYEQLDEISKATVGSYIKKAKTSAIGASQVAGMGSNIVGQKTVDKAERKVQKRASGINKAVDRLTREDTDFDDEGTLVSEKLSFSDFIDKLNEQLLEYETKSGVYRHKGSYGSAYQGDDDEEDKPKKVAAPDAPKRGRGRPAGSTGASYKPRSAETKAAAAAKAAASKAANKK